MIVGQASKDRLLPVGKFVAAGTNPQGRHPQEHLDDCLMGIYGEAVHHHLNDTFKNWWKHRQKLLAIYKKTGKVPRDDGGHDGTPGENVKTIEDRTDRRVVFAGDERADTYIVYKWHAKTSTMTLAGRFTKDMIHDISRETGIIDARGVLVSELEP